jgi:ribose transport system substrate-binding protein
MSDKPGLLVSLLVEQQEYQRLQATDARTVAARHGFAIDVVFAENSAILQIQQLYKAIHRPAEERVKAIVVETVVGEGLERVAKAAVDAGIGWVLINRRVPYLEGLRRKRPDLPICAVGTDQLEVGRLQARQFRALASEGVVLYIQGPADTSAAIERLQGAREGLEGTRLELRVLDGDWTETSGQKAVERLLNLKTSEMIRPALVGCQNDSMAVGARRALEGFTARPELARLPVTGCDGLAEGGRRMVDLRRLAATIVTVSNTGPAIDLLARWLKTGQQPVAEMLLQPTSYPRLEELQRSQASPRSPSGA